MEKTYVFELVTIECPLCQERALPGYFRCVEGLYICLDCIEEKWDPPLQV